VIHPFNVADTVYTRFNVEALKCLANVLISKVYLRDVLGFFEPITLFRASFLCEFDPGDNFATTMSVQYSSKILSKAFFKLLLQYACDYYQCSTRLVSSFILVSYCAVSY